MITNVLWYTAVSRVGASRATLFANIQPFFAALIAVVLLSEPLSWLQVAGGAAIAVALVLSRLQQKRPRSRSPTDRVRLASVTETDFFPIINWDHVELWVGNAKQAAYFYEHGFGFTPVAYAGPETGVRDRASYVLQQGEIRFVVTTGLRSDHEAARFASAHGDGVKDVALEVPSATEAYRQAVQRGARGVAEPHWVEDDDGRVELAAIATYGDVVHTFVNREEYGGVYLPGYVPTGDEPGPGVGLKALDHVVGNVELGRMDHWVSFYEQTMGFTELIHFSDEAIHTEYSALMSKVMFGGEGKIKFPINEPAEGKRKSQIEEYLEFNAGPGCSTSRSRPTTSSPRSRRSRSAGSASSARPRRTTSTSPTGSARSTRTGPTLRASASSPTATRTAICCRSSRRTRRTGRRCSSR